VPTVISHDGQRAATDDLTPAELSQTRGLLMKGQWRAIQSAPQYCSRIGMAASRVSKPTVELMREANSIMRELRKTAKENLVFHNFNYNRKQKLQYTDMVWISWGDAGHKNRHCGGSTGGLVVGVSVPSILDGVESPVSIIDWKSWKLHRATRQQWQPASSYL
jgi:hypothetical protein